MRRALCWLIATAALAVAQPVRELGQLPESMRLTRGNFWRVAVPWSGVCGVDADDRVVGAQLSQTLDGVGGVLLTAREAGDTSVLFRVLGIPVRTVHITVEPERVVVPGGQSIGVAIRTRGVLVVGASDVGGQVSPAIEAGLRSGDFILEADGETIEDCEHLSECVRAGKANTLTILREGKRLYVPISPKRDTRDNRVRLGAWVRDSTAGVGTLSFYMPDTGVFAALGHAVTDEDTGEILSVRVGEIFKSRVVGVLPGQKGEPGELTGAFFEENTRVGTVAVNGEYGIYGAVDDALSNALYPQGVAIRTRDEVKTGAAQILTTLDDAGIVAYDCEITRLFRQDQPGQRGMVVRVTDPALLDKTGGIVQGMSGSPIIQDGKLVGAVTHVFINDPTQGYGMYVDWMIEEAERAA